MKNRLWCLAVVGLLSFQVFAEQISQEPESGIIIGPYPLDFEARTVPLETVQKPGFGKVEEESILPPLLGDPSPRNLFGVVHDQALLRELGKHPEVTVALRGYERMFVDTGDYRKAGAVRDAAVIYARQSIDKWKRGEQFDQKKDFIAILGKELLKEGLSIAKDMTPSEMRGAFSIGTAAVSATVTYLGQEQYPANGKNLESLISGSAEGLVMAGEKREHALESQMVGSILYNSRFTDESLLSFGKRVGYRGYVEALAFAKENTDFRFEGEPTVENVFKLNEEFAAEARIKNVANIVVGIDGRVKGLEIGQLKLENSVTQIGAAIQLYAIENRVQHAQLLTGQLFIQEGVEKANENLDGLKLQLGALGVDVALLDLRVGGISTMIQEKWKAEADAKKEQQAYDERMSSYDSSVYLLNQIARFSGDRKLSNVLRHGATAIGHWKRFDEIATRAQAWATLSAFGKAGLTMDVTSLALNIASSFMGGSQQDLDLEILKELEKLGTELKTMVTQMHREMRASVEGIHDHLERIELQLAELKLDVREANSRLQNIQTNLEALYKEALINFRYLQNNERREVFGQMQVFIDENTIEKAQSEADFRKIERGLCSRIKNFSILPILKKPATVTGSLIQDIERESGLFGFDRLLYGMAVDERHFQVAAPAVLTPTTETPDIWFWHETVRAYVTYVAKHPEWFDSEVKKHIEELAALGNVYRTAIAEAKTEARILKIFDREYFHAQELTEAIDTAHRRYSEVQLLGLPTGDGLSSSLAQNLKSYQQYTLYGFTPDASLPAPQFPRTVPPDWFKEEIVFTYQGRKYRPEKGFKVAVPEELRLLSELRRRNDLGPLVLKVDATIRFHLKPAIPAFGNKLTAFYYYPSVALSVESEGFEGKVSLGSVRNPSVYLKRSEQHPKDAPKHTYLGTPQPIQLPEKETKDFLTAKRNKTEDADNLSELVAGENCEWSYGGSSEVARGWLAKQLKDMEPAKVGWILNSVKGDIHKVTNPSVGEVADLPVTTLMATKARETAATWEWRMRQMEMLAPLSRHRLEDLEKAGLAKVEKVEPAVVGDLWAPWAVENKPWKPTLSKTLLEFDVPLSFVVVELAEKGVSMKLLREGLKTTYEKRRKELAARLQAVAKDESQFALVDEGLANLLGLSRLIERQENLERELEVAFP